MKVVKRIGIRAMIQFPIHFLIFWLCNEIGVFTRQPIELLLYTTICLSFFFSAEYELLKSISCIVGALRRFG